MIIVSQDRKVIINFNNVTGIQVDDADIEVQLVNDDSLIIGEYKTEERAKEVLQEIAKRFSFIEINGTSYQQVDARIKLTQLARYEMPLE